MSKADRIAVALVAVMLMLSVGHLRIDFDGMGRRLDAIDGSPDMVTGRLGAIEDRLPPVVADSLISRGRGSYIHVEGHTPKILTHRDLSRLCRGLSRLVFLLRDPDANLIHREWVVPTDEGGAKTYFLLGADKGTYSREELTGEKYARIKRALGMPRCEED